jgi:NAD(P)-dependent dehydrogenase (short-subunit alcohol dehydrogenase family)
MLRLMDDPAAGRAYLETAVPMRRLGTAAEVAAVVCFAASAEAGYLTGTTVIVDGGLLAE